VAGLEQAVERIEYRQIGFATGQPLRAAPTYDDGWLELIRYAPREFGQQRGLADARLTADTNQLGIAGHDGLIVL
jgi:hypothetical protein